MTVFEQTNPPLLKSAFYSEWRKFPFFEKHYLSNENSYKDTIKVKLSISSNHEKGILKGTEEKLIKICHITPFFHEQYGGSERYVNTITKTQRKENFDITVLTTTRYRNRIGQELINGIKVVRFFSYKDIWRINPISFVFPYLARSKADILHIHSYLYFTSNQAAIMGKIRKIPVLLHLHGGIGYPPYRTNLIRKTAKAFYDRTLGKITFSCSNGIGSVSKNDILQVKNLYNISNGKLTYLPNAIDLELFKPIENLEKDYENNFTILFVGDLEPWKGILFLEKWVRNRRKLNNKNKLKIRFIGQGSCKSRIQELERTSKNSKITVEYLGEKTHNEIPKFLSEAQALILPSYWEGTPTVILEAMAARVPVVATPSGDIPHLIRHGKTGLLINQKFKSLDDAIDILIDNPTEAKKMGELAYQNVVREFSSSIVHKKIIRAYINLINGESLNLKIRTNK